MKSWWYLLPLVFDPSWGGGGSMPDKGRLLRDPFYDKRIHQKSPAADRMHIAIIPKSNLWRVFKSFGLSHFCTLSCNFYTC